MLRVALYSCLLRKCLLGKVEHFWLFWQPGKDCPANKTRKEMFSFRVSVCICVCKTLYCDLWPLQTLNSTCLHSYTNSQLLIKRKQKLDGAALKISALLRGTLTRGLQRNSSDLCENWIHPLTSWATATRSQLCPESPRFPSALLDISDFSETFGFFDAHQSAHSESSFGLLRESLPSAYFLFAFAVFWVLSCTEQKRTEQFFEVQWEHLRASVPVWSLPGITVTGESLPTEEAVRNV